MWREIFGGLVAPVTEWFKQSGERAIVREQGRTEIARAEIAADVASANAEAARAQSQTEAESNWDLQAADQAKRSWKDEYWTIVLSLPLLAAFVPGLAPYVARGFQALNTAPGWYQAGIAASLAFAFGIRHVVQMIQSRWGAR